jgi:adenylate cyclase
MAEGRVRRGLAAILAADVVGYSRLIRADEERTLARLKALRRELIDPKIAEHGGRIVKLMGDGMLAGFESVFAAVRLALEVQQAVAERNKGLPDHERIVFRVGVNLGDVVIEGDDIHGDGVNIAARLEGAGGTRRDLHIGRGTRSGTEPCRPGLRGHGPSRGQEY